MLVTNPVVNSIIETHIAFCQLYYNYI